MAEDWRKQIERLRKHLKEVERYTAGCMRNCRPRYDSEEYRWFIDIFRGLESCRAEVQWLENRIDHEPSLIMSADDVFRKQIEQEEAQFFARRRPSAASSAIRRDPQRAFSAMQKKEIYRRADGHCVACADPLDSDWHADHIVPHSRGGKTEVVNGQALCPRCNLRKSAKVLTVDEP